MPHGDSPSFRYVRAIVGPSHALLEFETTIDGVNERHDFVWPRVHEIETYTPVHIPPMLVCELRPYHRAFQRTPQELEVCANASSDSRGFPKSGSTIGVGSTEEQETPTPRNATVRRSRSI